MAPRRPQIRYGIAALCAALIPVSAFAALPVVPSAAGFGIDTPAGRGGKVHRVTNLNAKGEGSLRACIDAKGPRVCIFEVSGTIRLKGDLVVRQPNITIAGQTAPAPGILLRGGGLLIKTSDVLVQHLRVRPGDDPEGTRPDNRDALKIESLPATPIRRIVIDHCSFAWSVDETVSAWDGWDEVSILNSIIAEPLNDSIHPKGPHGYGLIVGPSSGRISIIGNLFAHLVSRAPLTNAARAVIVNNVIYNWSGMATDLQSRGAVTYNSVVGNIYLRGADNSGKWSPILLRMDATALPDGSKVYLADNRDGTAHADSWSMAGRLGRSRNLLQYKVSTPPVWNDGLTARPTRDDGLLADVLKNVGARPAERDAVDERIVEEVRGRKGRIVNCVTPDGTERCRRNAGGWPSLAENHRSLTLPENPQAMTPSGYTNLEIWLQALSAEVEDKRRYP